MHNRVITSLGIQIFEGNHIMDDNCFVKNNICVQMGLSVDDDKYEFLSDVSKALAQAETELQETQDQIAENL